MKRPGFKTNIQLKTTSGCKSGHFALIKGRPCLAATRKLLMQRKERVHPRVRAQSWQQHPRGDQRGRGTKFRWRGWHSTDGMALGVAQAHSSIMGCHAPKGMDGVARHPLNTLSRGRTGDRRLHLSNPKHPQKTVLQ